MNNTSALGYCDHRAIRAIRAIRAALYGGVDVPSTAKW
jgi:hypothetical protein